MKRELRYLVVKYKDMAKYLSDEDAVALCALASKVDAARQADNKPPLECVCVESDWPEYLETWTAIAVRVDKVDGHKARMQQLTDYPEKL